jgi:predicted secreted protein
VGLFALTAEVVTVNSVDYSDHLKSATLTVDAAQLDTTDFASGGWVEVIGGLKTGTLTLEFMDDVADNDVDEELFALIGTVVAFALKPVSGTISASVPEYQGFVLVTTYTVGGAVGDLAGKSLTWPISGSITRDITP